MGVTTLVAPGGDENDTGFSGYASVAFCHISRALFVSREDEVKMGRLVSGVVFYAGLSMISWTPE